MPSNQVKASQPAQPQSAHKVPSAEAPQILTSAGQLQRVYGNQALGRISVTEAQEGRDLLQRNPEEKSRHWKWKYGNKIGEEKRSSEKSREESVALLNATPEQAAKQISESLYSKQSISEKFQRVTFAMAGHDPTALRNSYHVASVNTLDADLTKVFQGKERMLEYLLDMLSHEGRPSIRMMLYTALGEVTGSGQFSKNVIIRQGPLSGNYTDVLGDSKRFAELLRRATVAERREVLADATLPGLLKKNGSKIWDIMIAQANVDVKQEEVDKAAALAKGAVPAAGPTKKDQDALTAQHELQLIGILKGSITAKVKFDRAEFSKGLIKWKEMATSSDILKVMDPNSSFQKELKGIDRLLPPVGDNKGFIRTVITLIRQPKGFVRSPEESLSIARDQQLTLFLKQSMGVGGLVFDPKKFYEFAMEWKASAKPADITRVTDPASDFQVALAKIDKYLPYVGMNGDAKTFVNEVITRQFVKPLEQQVTTNVENLERMGKYVGRETGQSHSNLRVKFNRFLNDKRWPDLINELDMMTVDQRDLILQGYAGDPTKPLDDASRETAVGVLEAKLKAAGMDKEERANIRAMFGSKHGETGGNYRDLWVMVEPGKSTRIKTKLTPKADLGKSIYKVILTLDDEEWLQVRQDKALMAKIKQHTDGKSGYWSKVLDVLGMQDENDQRAESGSLRKDTQAQLQVSKYSPRRFAYMLDNALKITKVRKKVSSEGEKARIYAIVSQAQAVAAQAERDGVTQADVFTNAILQELIAVDTGSTRKIDYLKSNVLHAYMGLKANQPIPVSAYLKRAKHEGFGVGEGKLKKVDRAKIVESFSHLRGRQLLDEWSNIADFLALRKQYQVLEDEMIYLGGRARGQGNVGGNGNQGNRPDPQAARLDVVLERLAEQRDLLKRFTLGIKQERRRDLKSIGVGAEDRIKIESMVSDKLIEAIDEDAEVQQILDEIEMPYDEYMQQKMKGVDALEMQRHLDTTRQWNLFATKGAQLKEATRNVKGSITSTESKQRGVEGNKTLSGEEQQKQLQEIRDKGAKSTKKDISDRNTIEARFRDMQKSFKQRASAIFKLIAAAIVTGLTMGIGAPIAIGIQIGVQIGVALLETAYNYYVLKENSLEQVAWGAFKGILQGTVTALTGNLAIALNQSILHPDMLGPGGAWVDRSISRSIATLMNSAVMFFPEHVRKQYMHEKELEKVIKEGEDTIADSALDALASNSKKIGMMFFMEMAKEGQGNLQALATGETYDSNTTTAGTFNERMNARMMGGSTQEEQDQIRDKMAKKQQRGAKKGMQKAFLMKPKNAEEKKNAKKVLKDTRKEQRGKEDKNATFKAIKEKLELKRNLAHDAGNADPQEFAQIMVQLGIDQNELAGLDDDEMAEVEQLMGMTPGTLEDYLVAQP